MVRKIYKNFSLNFIFLNRKLSQSRKDVFFKVNLLCVPKKNFVTFPSYSDDGSDEAVELNCPSRKFQFYC